MNTQTLAMLATLGLGTGVAMCAPAKIVTPESVAQGVVSRMTPSAKGLVTFKIKKDLADKIEIEGTGKGIAIYASDVRRLVSGYGWYLKNVANVHFSWNGNRLQLPEQLPQPESKLTIESPWKMTFAYNYCTLSYTAAFWDWKRWQREIDFLALSGFSHALVTAGLEKVWQEFLIKQKYPKDKIFKFIPNPAFAAWWNMGNLEGYGGPLSQQQIDYFAKLGKHIVARMTQLGMTPVLQGYVGFIPADFKDSTKINDLNVVPQGKWCGFVRPSVVDPTCPAFEKLAQDWYQSIEKVYGIKGKMFGGDLFHEGGSKGNINVSAAATAVQEQMMKAAPDSTWVLQAWHGNPSAELLKGVKKENTLVLNLTKNLSDRAISIRDFADIPCLWCELANFGGNTGMYGGLPLLSKLGTYMEKHKSKNVIGLGTLSEGLEINPLHYAMFTDRFWTTENFDMDAWLEKYAKQRYGVAPAEVLTALKILANTVYNPVRQQEGCTESIICGRPDWSIRKASTWASGERYFELQDVTKAAQSYLKAAQANPELCKLETFRYDLVDVVRQVLADAAYYQLQEVKAAFDNGKESAYKQEVAKFLELIKDLDAILSTDTQFLLGTWQARALAVGKSSNDKKLMSIASKRLITTWIDKAPANLNDYSNRQWAGLVADFYLPRWEKFFATQLLVLNKSKSADEAKKSFLEQTAKAELAFAEDSKVYPTKLNGNTLKVATQIWNKQKALLKKLCASQTAGGQKWDLKQGTTLSFDVTDNIDKAGTYTATIQWKSGANAVKIQSVKLFEGDKEVASDVHEGRSGQTNSQNVYTLKLGKYRTNLDAYTLKVEASGDGGNNSQGEMIFEKVK